MSFYNGSVIASTITTGSITTQNASINIGSGTILSPQLILSNVQITTLSSCNIITSNITILGSIQNINTTTSNSSNISISNILGTVPSLQIYQDAQGPTPVNTIANFYNVQQSTTTPVVSIDKFGNIVANSLTGNLIGNASSASSASVASVAGVAYYLVGSYPLTVSAITTQNGPINVGTGSITAGSITATSINLQGSAITGGSITTGAISTQNASINAGSGTIYASNISFSGTSFYIAPDSLQFRTSLQVNPVNQVFRVNTATQKIFTVTTVLNGLYLAYASNCLIHQNGVKLAYLSSNQYDYTITTSNTIINTYSYTSNVQTTFTVSLTNSALYGDVIDISIWPSLYTNQALIQPGYVYQVFCNVVWGLCNSAAVLPSTTTSVGIGTTNPQATLHVVGNIISTGAFYIGGDTPAFTASLQVSPVNQVFKIIQSKQQIFSVTTVLNGLYTANASNCAIYQNGIKLAYINSNLRDYTVTSSNTAIILVGTSSNVQTTFTVSLTNAALSGDVVDVTIWPTLYSNVASVQRGVVYQVFCNIVWGLSNNNAILGPNVTNVGIGTGVPLSNLHVQGNALITGNISFTGQLLQNGVPFVSGTSGSSGGSSQWTTSNTIAQTGSNSIYIIGSNVGIGTAVPQSNLDVRGTFGVTINNQLQFSVTSNTISIPSDTLSVPYVSGTTIVATNNIGIGTTQPNYALQAVGTIYASDTIASANPMIFRNRLYNGGMFIWQRATAGTSTAASTYTTADRWCGALGTTNLTLTQSSTVPTGSGYLYSLQVATTTTTASTPLIEQRIESSNVWDLLPGTNITVSFWAAQTSTPLMPLQINLLVPTTTRDTFSAQTQTGSTVTTPTLSSTFTYYTATFTLTAAGALTTTFNPGLAIRFTSGTTAAACTFLITGVQLEKGSIASPFEYRPYGVELQLCQRYYCKTFPVLVPPVAGAGQQGALLVTGGNSTAAAALYLITWVFPVQMFTAPLVTTYNPSTAGQTGWYDQAGANVAAAVSNNSTYAVVIYNSAVGTTGRNAGIHATASAEL